MVVLGQAWILRPYIRAKTPDNPLRAYMLESAKCGTFSGRIPDLWTTRMVVQEV